MTPKEKAKELYSMYNSFGKLNDSEVKECVLISVDSILEILSKSEYLEDRGEYHENRELIYWEEVKQEIEKL